MIESARFRFLRDATLCSMTLALASPLPTAHAQVTTPSPATSVPAPAGTATLRWPDVAYDSEHDVFLAVSGAGVVGGYWHGGDGAPIDAPFVVDDGGLYAQAPRVAYADDVGLAVTWHETLPGDDVRIRGRFVPYGGTASADFDVSSVATNWEMGAALAWSSASRELLVVYQALGDTRIGAQRVSATGALLGPPIVVDARAYYFRDPAVAYHAATDTFFVAYAGCVGTNDCFVAAQRVRAGTGELVSGPIELDASIDAGYVPEIAYASSTEDVLVVWHRIEAGSGSFQGRIVHADGTTAAPSLVTDAVGSYDANGLAYSAVSGTFLFVTHGTTSQDAAIELSSEGLPLGAPIPFGPVSAGGNFNPRVASRAGHPEWLAVTSSDFAMLTAQRFETTARPVAADGGAADASAALDGAVPVGDAGSTSDAGARADAGRARAEASGCGCRIGAPRRGAFPPVLGIALALAVSAFARRRPRPAP